MDFQERQILYQVALVGLLPVLQQMRFLKILDPMDSVDFLISTVLNKVADSVGLVQVQMPLFRMWGVSVVFPDRMLPQTR